MKIKKNIIYYIRIINYDLNILNYMVMNCKSGSRLGHMIKYDLTIMSYVTMNPKHAFYLVM